jgi:hypothetical protein
MGLVDQTAWLKCTDSILTACPSGSTPSLLGEIIALYDFFETIIDFDFQLFLLGATEPWIRLQPRKPRVSRRHSRALCYDELWYGAEELSGQAKATGRLGESFSYHLSRGHSVTCTN